MRSLALLLTAAFGSMIYAADPVLTVEGVTHTDGSAVPAIRLSLAEIAAMPHTKATVTEGGQPHLFEGVPVSDVLKKAGQPLGQQMRRGQLVKYAVFTAHDGYRVLFSLPELDPAFTAARALIADSMDGQPLPEKKGPLWLVVPDEKSAARSVYMLERIEIQSAPQPAR